MTANIEAIEGLRCPIKETSRGPKSHKQAEDENLNDTTEINYLYLTFRTPLPSVNTTALSGTGSGREPTPSPDLSKYANPMTWPNSRKYTMLFLSCIATFLTAYTSGSYSPPQDLMRKDLGASSSVVVLLGITMFCVGFGLAPMVLAPFSEMNGRYPVFIVSGIVYVVFQAVCGVVRNLTGMLLARLLVGIGASVFSTMVGGVIADMWDKEGRNTPMALFSGFVLAGTGAGPLFAAMMTQRLGDIEAGNAAAWKWVFWHQVIMGTVCMIALVFLLKESRGSVLLSRKARALNKWYEQLENDGYYGVWVEETQSPNSSESATPEVSSDEEKGSMKHLPPNIPAGVQLKRIRWLVKEDEERSSLGKMIKTSVTRPFQLLCTESIVFFFSLWVAFAWGVLYLTFGSIPLIFRRQYGWDIEKAGLVFNALIIGSVFGTAMGIWQQQMLRHPRWANPALPSDGPKSRSDRIWALIRRRFPADSPESRLYFTCITSTLLPIGLFIFGFTARPHIHWIVPSFGIVLVTMGILSIYLAIFNYFADAYHQYASSALAAQSLARNLVGGAFPLVTASLIEILGETRATATLGAIAVVLSVVPWILVFYGERIRARSPFANQLEKL